MRVVLIYILHGGPIGVSHQSSPSARKCGGERGVAFFFIASVRSLTIYLLPTRKDFGVFCGKGVEKIIDFCAFNFNKLPQTLTLVGD